MNIDKFCILLGFLSFLIIFQAIYIMDHLPKDLRIVEELPVEVRREIENQAENDLVNFEMVQNKNISRNVFVWFEKKENSFDPNLYNIEIWMDAKTPVNIVDLKIDYKGLLIIDEDENKIGTQISFGEASRYLENDVSIDNSKLNLVAEFENGFSGKLLLGTISVKKIDDFWGTELSVNLIKNSKEESYAIGFGDRSENILSESAKLVF